MSRTFSLRRQHDAALDLVQQARGIIAAIGARPTEPALFCLILALGKLADTLRLHLAHEDRCLYPEMMASGRRDVAATAHRFFEERGHLAPQAALYFETWLGAGAILRDWDNFRLASAALFSLLADRIRCENEILYPMADALAEEKRSARAA